MVLSLAISPTWAGLCSLGHMTTPTGTELWKIRRERSGGTPFVKDIQDGCLMNHSSRFTQRGGDFVLSAYDETNGTELRSRRTEDGTTLCQGYSRRDINGSPPRLFSPKRRAGLCSSRQCTETNGYELLKSTGPNGDHPRPRIFSKTVLMGFLFLPISPNVGGRLCSSRPL